MGIKLGEPGRVKPGQEGYIKDVLERHEKKRARVMLEALFESARPRTVYIHGVGEVRI